MSDEPSGPQQITLEEIERRAAEWAKDKTPEELEAIRQSMITPEEYRRRTPSKRALLDEIARRMATDAAKKAGRNEDG